MATAYCAINSMVLDGKLPEGDRRWRDFNGSFANAEIETLDFADQIVAGHAYTSWHDPNYRHSDNWQMSQLLAVDMDTEDKRSGFDYLREHDMVACFATLMHTTPSHTAQKPRSRVVFFLDRPITSPTAYSTASKFISTILGGDEVATDPSRFFYGNRYGQVEILGNTLSADYLYMLYKRCTKPAKPRLHKPAPVTPTRFDSGDDGNDRQKIQKLLDKINPWEVEYIPWCRIVAAIKYELGEEGLPIAIAWADGKQGEVEKMWRSFKRTGGNVSTLGTIVYFATMH